MNSMAPSVKQNFYRDQKRSIQKKTETEKVLKRRIYLEDYNPSKVLSLLDELEPYYAFTKEYSELISEAGLYRIIKKENRIEQLKQKDLPLVSKKNYLPGKHLLIDYSHFEEIADISQIPVEHTLLNYTCFHYCFYGTAVKRSLLYLVVEGTFREKPEKPEKPEKVVDKNRYKGFTICDLYFISDEDVENSLIKKELNEFLLLLI